MLHYNCRPDATTELDNVAQITIPGMQTAGHKHNKTKQGLKLVFRGTKPSEFYWALGSKIPVTNMILKSTPIYGIPQKIRICP